MIFDAFCEFIIPTDYWSSTLSSTSWARDFVCSQVTFLWARNIMRYGLRALAILTHAHQKCNDLSFVPLSPQGLCTVLGSLGIRIVPQFDRTIILTLNVWKEVMFGWYNFLFCQAEWEKVFSEASLNLVAVRKSFYGSALFLCRCPSPSKKPVFLPVESTDYKWVETLKVSSITFWMCLSFEMSKSVPKKHVKMAGKSKLKKCFMFRLD